MKDRGESGIGVAPSSLPSLSSPLFVSFVFLCKTQYPLIRANAFDSHFLPVSATLPLGMIMNTKPFQGLIAAPHTPFLEDGRLNLSRIELQYARLRTDGVAGAFVCGSTGEGLSLSTEERKLVATRWREVIGKDPFRLIVHVGHTSLNEACDLAMHARKLGAAGISSIAPIYFKPTELSELIDYCAPIAAAGGDLPFYYYDIPSLTGVTLSASLFLEQAHTRIPSLGGVKFSNTNLCVLQECLHAAGGRYEVYFGSDEMLLASLALGVTGAVGSTYNYIAPLYNHLIQAWNAGHLDQARSLQLRSVRLVGCLARFGALAAGKAMMARIGIDCGPVRSPLKALDTTALRQLFEAVDQLEESWNTTAQESTLFKT